MPRRRPAPDTRHAWSASISSFSCYGKMETSTMVLRKKVRALLKRLLYARRVTAHWYIEDVNWGDALNPVLIEYLAERKARFDADPYMEKQMVVGSILQLADSN